MSDIGKELHTVVVKLLAVTLVERALHLIATTVIAPAQLIYNKHHQQYEFNAITQVGSLCAIPWRTDCEVERLLLIVGLPRIVPIAYPQAIVARRKIAE